MAIQAAFQKLAAKLTVTREEFVSLGLTVIEDRPAKDGLLMHASLMINDGMVMLVDEFPDMPVRSPLALGGTAVTLHIYSPDAKAAIAKAAAAGATVTMEAQPMFWGDMYGMVTDPFGHVWSIATPMGPPKTSAELAAAMAEA